MKRYLGSLLAIVALTLLGGCGDDPENEAEDPASTPTTTTTTTTETTDTDPTGTGDPTARVVDIVSGSAAGGEVAETATVIEDDQALARYLEQFEPAFAGVLSDAVEAHELADGRVLGLAVIEISCDEPPSATVTEEDGEWVVTAGKVVAPHPECYAPVTSVAVLDLPAR